MNASIRAQKILKEIPFDFATFTMDRFLDCVSQVKGREILTIPWEMPSTLFGAWISNGEEPREYIFYRSNISEIHQIHVQLHELSHFLFGHPTLKITRERIVEVAAGIASLPFEEMPQLRSPKSYDLEPEAEILASLIQQKAIRNLKLDSLVHDRSPKEKRDHFLKTMGLL